MKAVLVILSFFYNPYIFSQEIKFNNKVEYDMNFMLKNYNSKLFYNSERSIFTFYDLEKNNYTQNIESFESFDLTIVDTSTHLVYNNNNDKNMYAYTCIFTSQKHDWTEETTPDFNWIKSNETKIINNLICNKATCTFRGRKYTAWYSTEIQNDFGPWKFRGLPGLILEVYDSENQVHFLVKKIQIPFDTSFHINPINTIPFDRIKQIQKDKTDELIKLIESKQERGFTIKVKVEKLQQIEKI